MDDLHIDFESYSEAPLGGTKSVGAWAYSCHPSTEVLMLAWAFDNDDPEIWLPGTPRPGWVNDLRKYHNPFNIVAWNDFFELSLMANVLKWKIPDAKYWIDSAQEAAALALPRKLADCGEALGLAMDEAKDPEGKKLITMFCSPKKSTAKATKGQLIRKMGADYPEQWAKFIRYCKGDVIAERAVRKHTRPLRESERELAILDRRINLRGVRFDMPTVKDAIYIRDKVKADALAEVDLMTGGELANINSRDQFITYMGGLGVELENAQKEYLKATAAELTEELQNVETEHGFHPENNNMILAVELLNIRLRIAKASLAKYDKLIAIVGSDDRARGLLRFLAASTGRWAGQLFQPQNLPRPSFKNTDLCISLFHHRDYKLLMMLYGEPMEALSSCLRGMIIPSPGNRLVVSDFSQIESRVLRWLAGDVKGLDSYRQGLDIYKVNASGVFKTTYDLVSTKQRLIGKVIELACGYQGAVGAFQTFADVYGVVIPDEQAKAFVGAWRTANPKIVSYWYNVEATAVKAVAEPGSVQRIGNIQFKVIGSGRDKFLFCKLPSGRAIAYHRPSLVDSQFGRKQISFWGVDSLTKKYVRKRTYGGSLVENITQAVARDLMAEAMPKIEAAGYPIVLDVHDEVMADVPEGHGSIEEFNSIMTDNPDWAEGIPIAAEGYEAQRYRK